MCVMLYIPAGKEVSKKTLRQCFNSNPHSIGYMYHSRAGVQVWKGFDFEKFYTVYLEDKAANPASDFAVHFRIATSGKKDIANCHPFTFGNKHLMHNGILPRVWGSAEENDTREFIRVVLAPLSEALDIMDNTSAAKALRVLVSEYIETDKFIIFDDGGRVKIINPEYGETIGDVWFSNTYWKPVKSRKQKRGVSPGGLDFGGRPLRASFDSDKCSICFIDPPLAGDVCEACIETYGMALGGNE